MKMGDFKRIPAVRRRIGAAAVVFCLCMGLLPCSSLAAEQKAGAGKEASEKAEAGKEAEKAETEWETAAGTEEGSGVLAELGEAAQREKEAVREGLPFTFVDVYGQCYATQLDERVRRHAYDWSCLKREGFLLRYEGDPAFTYRLGLDVSSHQGDVDWERVREQGFSFVFLRIGYRGYGQEGRLCVDKRFHENYRGARDAGLDVGVYFFSQAISEEEAAEEAELVLQNLEGYELQCPVVFDPESILDDEARTDGVPGEQFTRNTLVFCSLIREAGFAPMIYSNMLWEAYQLDLYALSEYPIWYADYEPAPQTPYHFEYWQYDNKGRIDGIEADTDLNIQFLPLQAS